MFLDFEIKFGIELNKAFLFDFKLSKAPDLTSPSNWSLFISFGFTRFKKSVIDLNLPFLDLSSIILDTASYPTALIPPRA